MKLSLDTAGAIQILRQAGLYSLWFVSGANEFRDDDKKHSRQIKVFFTRKHINDRSGNDSSDIRILMIEDCDEWLENGTQKKSYVLTMGCVGKGWQGSDIPTEEINIMNMTREEVINIAVNYILKAEISYICGNGLHKFVITYIKEKFLIMKVLIRAAKDDNYPKVGPFYFYNDTIIAPDEFQKKVDPVTHIRGSLSVEGEAGEHRDFWDKYMVVQYSELKEQYNDDHKALPRGRVDYKSENGELKFWVTLDRCIINKESEIKRIYNLKNYTVEFHYGTMNYKCMHCQ